MDTDSLVIFIMCRNNYVDMNYDIEFCDTSNLTKTLKIQSNLEFTIKYLDY